MIARIRRGRLTRRIAASVAVAVCGAVAVVAVWYRSSYGTFWWWQTPVRITWCDRQYLPGGGRPIDMAEVQRRRGHLPGDSPYPVATVGKVPPVIGHPLLASLTPPDERARLGLPCAMEVFLQIGPDAYLPYVISGGP